MQNSVAHLWYFLASAKSITFQKLSIDKHLECLFSSARADKTLPSDHQVQTRVVVWQLRKFWRELFCLVARVHGLLVGMVYLSTRIPSGSSTAAAGRNRWKGFSKSDHGDLLAFESTLHLWVRKRQPQSEWGTGPMGSLRS